MTIGRLTPRIAPGKRSSLQYLEIDDFDPLLDSGLILGIRVSTVKPSQRRFGWGLLAIKTDDPETSEGVFKPAVGGLEPIQCFCGCLAVATGLAGPPGSGRFVEFPTFLLELEHGAW